mgnify:CR=1 FL=1
MATHSFALVQSGYDSGIGWVSTTSDLQFLFAATVGLRFTFDGAARKLWSAPTLTLTRTGGVGGTGTLTVRGVKRMVAPAFSSTRLPGDERLETLYSASATLSAASPTVAVPLATHDSVGGLTTYFMGLLSGATSSTVLGLVVDFDGGNVLGSATLSATYARDLTGVETSVRRMSRADECPKCGTEGFREEWVPDLANVTSGGGGAGQLVCPSCADPPSPPRGPRTRLREVNP